MCEMWTASKFIESDLMKQLEEYDEEMEKEQSRYVTIKDKK